MLNPRLSTLPEYPFQRLRELLDPIDPPAAIEPLVLSIGEPRHPPPPMIAEIFAASADLWGRYPPGDGTPEFRAATAAWLAARYGLDNGAVDPDRHVLPVAGTREALYLVSALAVPRQKGGRQPVVALPNPFYHVYGGAAAVSGAESLYLPAGPKSGFLPDITLVDEKTLERTAMYYFCSPANPQGAVAGLDVLKAAIELAREYDFVLVADECYAEIYDREPPPGALEACKQLGDGFDNVLVFHSLSKRSSAPGLRSGFVAGDEKLIRPFKRLRNYVGPQVPMPTMAASAALWSDESHVEENRRLYRAKFDIAEEILGGRFGFYRPEGGFFLWLDVGDGEAAARKLWAEAGVRVLPGAYIGRDDGSGVNPGSPFIRLALVDDPESTTNALEKIVKVL
ncbi:MAG: aspartate aminotransferase [Rhodospirillaceae bacterium]|jgi:succinyldiaminopimelate transaminase|nr:aspartate aminotransferase [Rhodospirillaceae bacterium]